METATRRSLITFMTSYVRFYSRNGTCLSCIDSQASGISTTSFSGCEAIPSALALHRVVREPLELGREWMRKAHLALRHDQACGILFGRNPPLRACASAPKELAARILMVEGRRVKGQRSRESVPAALQFAVRGKAY